MWVNFKFTLFKVSNCYSVQFNFIYTAPNHKNSRLKLLYTVR